MTPSVSALKPRKTPVQARSTQTVEVILQACIQVLMDGGLERLTTTRVAQRAGTSVGSIYQYFPNKQSLLAAVLERHLMQVVMAVEAACASAKGQSTAAMASAVVDAFVNAKFADPAASRALYAVAAEVGGASVVAQLTQRSQLALCDMLAAASDRTFSDLAALSFVLSTAVIAPVQGLLATNANAKSVHAVQSQLTMMMSAYLQAVGTVKRSASMRNSILRK
jgi:AcrR family transcriptional regulator